MSIRTASFRLGELMSARICHDVSGLAGALSGTLELVEAGGEAVEIAREAARDLTERIRLLRAVFGPPAEPLAARDVAELARGLGGRYRVDASRVRAGALSPERGKLALAMLLLAADALPAGGELSLRETPRGGLRVEGRGLRAGSRRLGDATPLDPPAVTPERLVAHACGAFADAAGLTLAIAGEPPAVRVDAVPRSSA